MFPVLARNTLESARLLASAARLLAEKALPDIRIHAEALEVRLWLNPILATALTPLIGYEKAAAIAKKAYAEGRSVLEVAVEETGEDEGTLRSLMDPRRMADGPEA